VEGALVFFGAVATDPDLGLRVKGLDNPDYGLRGSAYPESMAQQVPTHPVERLGEVDETGVEHAVLLLTELFAQLSEGEHRVGRTPGTSKTVLVFSDCAFYHGGETVEQDFHQHLAGHGHDAYGTI
jgi:hypothetical protein